MRGILEREEVIRAIASGIEIDQDTDLDLFIFGERLIDWVNCTPNDYWVSWDYDDSSQIVIDVKTMPLLKLKLSSKRVQFQLCYEPHPGDEDLVAPDIGSIVIGICLFCKLETGEIEQHDNNFEQSKNEDRVTKVVLEEATKEPTPDFEWI